MRKFTLPGLLLLAALCTLCIFPATARAETITVVPDDAYTVSGGTITGISSTWLDTLTEDETGTIQISVVIPAQVNSTNITAIGANAFHTNRTASGDSAAYSDYSTLRIVDLDLSGTSYLTTINSSAFYNQSGELYSALNVSSFTFPSSVTSILGNYTFAGQSGLKGELKMPDSMTTLGNGGQRVFQDCTGFTSLDLNNVLTINGTYTFFRCTGLESINLSTVQYLNGYNNFSSCSGLEGTLEIPASLRSLGTDAQGSQFTGCGTASAGFTIEFVTTDMRITTIPMQTFNGAKVIGDLVIPEGITAIGNNAFASASDATNPETITSVTLPSTIRSIGNSAFNNCTMLAEITFPASLNASGAQLTIGNNAFQYFAVKVLTVPEYVSSLGTQCFRSSTLTTVYLNAAASDLTFVAGNSPFYTMASTAVVIATDATQYAAWKAKITATPINSQLTYEMQVDFCDPDTDVPIASMAPLAKLYSKSLAYVENSATGEWTLDDSYRLPGVPSEYPDAKGWSFAPTGSAIIATSPIIVTETKLYPTEAGLEYIWFGQYQQTLIQSSIGTPNPPAGTEGVDYVTLYVQAADPAADSYRYYKIEPIRWRILEQDDKTYTLISESILDSRVFANAASGDSARWSNSDIRAWLNGTGTYAEDGFIDQAFSTTEVLLIDDMDLDNDYEGGNWNTTDKIYLPTYMDIFMNTTYFATAADRIPDYLSGSYGDAKMSVITIGSPSYYKYWWTRSLASDLGNYASQPVAMHPNGTNINIPVATANGIGIRPMVTFTLTDDFILTHTGSYTDPYVIVAAGPDADEITLDDVTKTYGDAPFNIPVTIVSSGYDESDVQYSFSGDDILSYDSATGLFTILGSGTVTVTGTLPGGAADTCTVTVNAATPTVSVSASPGTVTPGQNVTLTATVAGVSGGTTPAGTVQFLVNGVPVGSPQAVIGGMASLTVTDLTVFGSARNTITAMYIPAAGAPYASATSNQYIVAVAGGGNSTIPETGDGTAGLLLVALSLFAGLTLVLLRQDARAR